MVTGVQGRRRLSLIIWKIILKHQKLGYENENSHKHYRELPDRWIGYSKTCYGRPPLRPSKSGLTRQVISHDRGTHFRKFIKESCPVSQTCNLFLLLDIESFDIESFAPVLTIGCRRKILSKIVLFQGSLVELIMKRIPKINIRIFGTTILFVFEYSLMFYKCIIFIKKDFWSVVYKLLGVPTCMFQYINIFNIVIVISFIKYLNFRLI
jgi:hypothetical protein